MKRAVVIVVAGAGFAVAAGVPVAVAVAAPPDPPPEDGEVEDQPSASAAPAPPPHAHAAASASARISVPFQDGMLRLPGGKFTMGTSDPQAPRNERPAHAAQVAPFWIDKTEVSVGAYRACVEKHLCAAPQKTSALCTFEMDDPELPVSCVRYGDAETYCRAVGKRLPREAEWEFAARGTMPLRYPFGWGATCATANTLFHEGTARSCSGKRPSKVGSHPAGASPFGVLDLSGNVEEWTSDWYAENQAEGASPRSGSAHVLRGGGWLSGPAAARTTARNWGSALEAGPNVGFRCAKDG